MGLFGTDHAWGPKNPTLCKICLTNTTIIKLATVIPYHKKIQIYMNHMTHLLSSAAFFLLKSENFAISRSTDIDCILINSLYKFPAFV